MEERKGGIIMEEMAIGVFPGTFKLLPVAQSCENPHIQYIDLPDIRLIFFDGE